MDKTRHLVFAVGSGRSGTTLLAKLLDSSPEVFYRHEPDATKQCSELPFMPGNQDAGQYQKTAADYLRELTHQRDAKTCGTMPMFSKSFRGGLGNAVHRGAAMLAKVLGKANLSFDIPDFARPGADPIYVIKSVESLCRSELFLRSTPELRVLHIIRHSCAVIASQLRGMEKGVIGGRVYADAVFDAEMAESYPFTREEMAEKTWEEQIAFQWMAQNDFVYRRIGGDERYRLVRYEELCTNFAEQARSIFDFAQISWSLQTGAFVDHLLEHRKEHSSYFSIQKRLTGSLYTWKKQISAEHIRAIEKMMTLSPVGLKVLEYGES